MLPCLARVTIEGDEVLQQTVTIIFPIDEIDWYLFITIRHRYYHCVLQHDSNKRTGQRSSRTADWAKLFHRDSSLQLSGILSYMGDLKKYYG